MLAAVDALSRVDGLDDLTKQVWKMSMFSYIVANCPFSSLTFLVFVTFLVFLSIKLHLWEPTLVWFISSGLCFCLGKNCKTKFRPGSNVHGSLCRDISCECYLLLL